MGLFDDFKQTITDLGGNADELTKNIDLEQWNSEMNEKFDKAMDEYQKDQAQEFRDWLKNSDDSTPPAP